MLIEIHGMKNRGKPGSAIEMHGLWWYPLWEYICEHCKDILGPEQIDSGYERKGEIVSKYQVDMMVKRLEELILKGETRAYERKFAYAEQKNYENHFKFHEENVKEFIEFAKVSDGFAVCQEPENIG